MAAGQAPVVSCLCVTERRPAFMPWLLWCFDRQTWSQRELVIVDSSPVPCGLPQRDDVRVLSVPAGSGVARKRNLALQEARGELITWFDDDDWQHPDKLLWLVEGLRHGAPYGGSCHAWFVDLMGRRCTRYRAPKRHVVFNSAGFQREVALSCRFQEHLRQASDTRWMQDLAAHYQTRAWVGEREDLFFWLCHAQNLSNPATRRHFPLGLDVLKEVVGVEAWGDTDEALNALRMRLQGDHQAQQGKPVLPRQIGVSTPRTATSQRRWKDRADGIEETGEAPAVGLMIKATVLDAPFLDVMVRHMVSQARYPFAERTIVVERQPTFSGKYQARPRASREELDRILERLLADGMIDHVRDVDMAPALVTTIMQRYFAEEALRVPTHAATGGPIYATLFGLESMSTDYVLQMDADVFFHTGSESWVRQALACMTHDPRLWLMMTHPGPPTGPPGNSLGPRNARRATWDPELRIWRFGHATTRYFLCDRRTLRQRLRPVWLEHGCAPLEQCLSDALRRHGAFRGALGDLESWHLHVWYHGDPFPLWSPALADAIAAGSFPALQRGEYDLRLDRIHDRRAWQALLERPRAEAPTTVTLTQGELTAAGHAQAAVEMQPLGKESVGAQRTETGVNGAPAPLAVVIPVRNRAGQRLRNAIRSLNWQEAGRPAQVIVVSYGSQPDINRELSALCEEEGAALMAVGAPVQAWNKSLALNIGIRATSPEVPFVMTMDADMILAGNFFTAVLDRLQREPPALVLCRISDLPRHVLLPSGREQLVQAFDRLHAMTRLRNQTGTGGIQAARRAFFFDIRGYDEDLLWWGAMDGDMVQRARLGGLRIEWIESCTTMLHQWHPRKHSVLSDPDEIAQAKQAWQRNHELVRSRVTTLRRNPDGWGGQCG